MTALETQSGADQTGSTGTERRSGNQWVVLAIVLSAVFMQLLDTTITTVAVTSIQAELHASSAEIQLVLAGYSLAFACTLITGGRLGDLYGRRRLFLIGMAGFTVVSAVCGAAPNPTTLVVARLVQGVFSALMFPQVLAIVQVVFTDKARSKAVSAYGATIGLATILGPVAGGLIIKLDVAQSDWRGIFYINVPIGVVAVFAGLRWVPESRVPSATRLDLPGATLVTAGLFMLIFPLVIGREQAWPVWSVAMMGASVVVLVAFYLLQRARTRNRAHGDPLVNVELFANRGFSGGLLACLLFFTGIPSFFFILLLTLQSGYGYSALSAGAVTLAFAIAVAVGSARSAIVARHLGGRVLVLGAGLLAVGQGGLIVTLHNVVDDMNGWLLAPALLVAGLGAGLFLAPVTSVVLASVRKDDAGSASGLLATAQQVGAAVGIAVVGVIFFAQLGANSGSALDHTEPGLRAELTSIGVPAAARNQIVQGVRTCLTDRTHSSDSAVEPASCTRARAAADSIPLPPAQKAMVSRAVLQDALPEARAHVFGTTLAQALWWQIGAFLATVLLVLTLRRVSLDGSQPITPGG